MIIVADSGSTKTDWRIIGKTGVIEGTQTKGLNPYQHSKLEFEAEIENSIVKSWANMDVEEIFFYGSGVTGEEMIEELEARFKIYFTVAKLSAASDLLGAARALLRNTAGLVGVLGTGSNSGWYDGLEVINNVPPLGYVLGDEGSGNALGRRLITEFLRQKLPLKISKDFEEFYPEHKNLITKIYSSPEPSRLFASFVPFLYKFKEDEYLVKLICKEFNNYFDILTQYDNWSNISLVGSVAHYFKDILDNVAASRGIIIDEVLKSPIDALTLHHKLKLS